MKYIAYTDGASRNNPGKAGIGAYIVDGEGSEIKKASEYIGEATNNVAEYKAVILALETLKKIIPKEKKKDAEIEIRMDSELVQKQLTGQYQIKQDSLFPLFIHIWNIQVSTFPRVIFTHVRREQNKEADALANKAIDESGV